MNRRYPDAYYHMAAEIIMNTAAQIWELQWHNSEWKDCPVNAHRTYSIDVLDDDEDVYDTWKFRIECGFALDCVGKKCEGECDDLSTVNIDIGWAGISKEDAFYICEIIDKDDERFSVFWFWNDGVTK
jgi:hypothetical protein